jgi:hypothetical protein
MKSKMREALQSRLEEQLNQLQENIKIQAMKAKAAKNKAFCQHQSEVIK